MDRINEINWIRAMMLKFASIPSLLRRYNRRWQNVILSERSEAEEFTW